METALNVSGQCYVIYFHSQLSFSLMFSTVLCLRWAVFDGQRPSQYGCGRECSLRRRAQQPCFQRALKCNTIKIKSVLNGGSSDSHSSLLPGSKNQSQTEWNGVERCLEGYRERCACRRSVIPPPTL